MKPASWPRYLDCKKLRSGDAANYWNPPNRDLARGFPLHREALGTDLAAAIERANFLNAHLDAWRKFRSSRPLEIAQPGYGTVAWLFDRYFKSDTYKRSVSDRSDGEYRRALARIEDIPTSTGGRFGDLLAKSVSPGAVDKIYTKLRKGPRRDRVRQANLSIVIAARAWDVVWRAHPSVVHPHGENPWRGVELDTRKATKPAATRAEAYALAVALREIGEEHLGAAALICFEWHMRPEHVLDGRITWSDVRPRERPDSVHIMHHKTGVKGWPPLEDEDRALYPELEAYLASLPRLGSPIVLTSARRGPARPYSHGYAQRRVRDARSRAGLSNCITLDACRHGGLTELARAGATEAESRASSMHKSAHMLHIYQKETDDQRVTAARKRRDFIDQNKSGARVRIERQHKSQNERER